MLADPNKGVEQVETFAKETYDPMKLIEASVMFDSASFQSKRSSSNDVAPPQPFRDALSVATTVRNTKTSSRRNDPCPCGSGKKYKKCCLRK